MAGVVPIKLNELQQNSKNAIVTALVLTKTSPKYFMVKKSMDFRGVITFTLRDSKSSICNLKYWGSREIIEEYNRKMKIGDVINVVCPLVIYQKFYDESNRFLPIGTLPIFLVINEGEGSLGWNVNRDAALMNRLQELMFIPHKPLRDALRLCDVRFSYMASNAGNGADKLKIGQKTSSMPSQSVDLVVMVAQVRTAKDLPLNQSRCLEVVVFDQSVPDGMLLSIWHNEWIQRAELYWQPMKTVLHLIDVDAIDSSYYNSCILRKSSRTIIYENPIGKEVSSLREFAVKMKPQDFNMVGQSRRVYELPNPDDIRTQMTVKQIYARLDGKIKDDSEEFTAVVTGMITKFNIDVLGSVIGRKCKTCQRILSAYATVCHSDKCLLAFSLSNENDHFDFFYNLNIQISDHTGTLIEARVTDAVGESIFKISATTFQKKFKENEENLECLKWSYLFKRFEAKLLIKKATFLRRRPMMLVIAMQPTEDLNAAADKIMVF